MDFYMQFSLTIASGARMDLQNRREGKKNGCWMEHLKLQHSEDDTAASQ